jgi:single-stranded-DNA-specific exonuclease
MITPKIQPRAIDSSVEREAIALGLDPVLARIIAGRITSGDGQLRKLLAPTLGQLDDPRSLSDIEKAADRLARAVINGEHIGLATDHDADGVTSCAVFKEALTSVFGVKEENVSLYISHRLREGYGLNAAVADRILSAKQRPSLIITADKGSSDEPRIAMLAAEGIDVIVSDHHEFPVDAEGKPIPPKSAYAVVSPKHPDGKYPDDKIAGCMVAWLLIAQTHRLLTAAQKVSADQNALKDLLMYVAIGTVADCVSLGRSHNNRAVVREGLKRIRESKRPTWEVLRAHFGAEGAPVRTDTLAFQICPRLAAAGRMDVAEPGIKFLMAQQKEVAERWYAFLTEENDSRKQMERKLKDLALDDADTQAAYGKQTIVVDLGAEGHSGVHGIVASRIVERHGRPTVMISPKKGQLGVVSGSCRSVPGVHLREALQWVSDRSPGLFKAFGGHVGAAGLTIEEKDIAKFADMFEQAVREQLKGRELGPVRFSDGELPAQAFTTDFLDAINQLEPWGREFEYPLFEGTFLVKDVRVMGADKNHMSLTLERDRVQTRAVWFNAIDLDTGEIPVAVGDRLKTLFSLSDNYWKNRRSLQLMIEAGIPQRTPKLELEPSLVEAEQEFEGFECAPSI